MTYDLIETLIIASGSLVLLLSTFWLVYRAYVLRLKSKSVDPKALDELKARVAELETQLADKKVSERLAVLEEIVTSEDFDLNRKLREVERVVQGASRTNL